MVMDSIKRGRKRGRPGQSSIETFRERTILLEHHVKIFDFMTLTWEGHSLISVFIDRGWTPIGLDQKDEACDLMSYIDIVSEFYKELDGISPDEGGECMISIQGASVLFLADRLADFIGIPKLRTVYSNVVVRESPASGDGETAEDEGLAYTDELDSLEIMR
ncbi:hypothetical protein F2P56_002320 [Juglans regia]|uniref:Uncharacterized protein n=1 Tax=Juglans regia TaxID=51240 RepID=A0A833YEZ3_JUGRE|nr:hypothetical protein F2P56_002320 [Juglans regia]